MNEKRLRANSKKEELGAADKMTLQGMIPDARRKRSLEAKARTGMEPMEAGLGLSMTPTAKRF